MKKDQTLQVRTGGETGLMNNKKELERIVWREVAEWDISRKISVMLGPGLHRARSFIYSLNIQCCSHSSCVPATVLAPGSSGGAVPARPLRDQLLLSMTPSAVLRTAPQGQSWPKGGNLRQAVGP